MKNRHGATSTSNTTSFNRKTTSDDDHNEERDVVTGVSASECNTAEPSDLAKDIQQYLSQQVGRCASSDDLTLFFEDRIGVGNNVLFKEILKRLCTFKKGDDSGIWTLRSEFL